MKRISKDEYYLGIAMAVSKRSTCLRRRYGAVIVTANDEIVATGYNGAARREPNCCDVFEECPRKAMAHNSGDYSDCPAVHAEQNALLSAARGELNGATLYLNGEEFGDSTITPMKECLPCPICGRMIRNSGILRVVGPQDIRKKG